MVSYSSIITTEQKVFCNYTKILCLKINQFLDSVLGLIKYCFRPFLENSHHNHMYNEETLSETVRAKEQVTKL